ncbi:aldehyde dehydrogenase family protein, partial [Streptomyces sp. NPDC001500]
FPALAAGNAVVLKPAEATPLTALPHARPPPGGGRAMWADRRSSRVH